MRVESVILCAVLASACAQTQASGPHGETAPAKGAKGTKAAKAAPKDTATTESVAFEAERRLNAAESALEALKPDQAVEELEAADRQLSDPKIETYPDAKQLQEHYRELLAKVPQVREEVRRRELAAAVEAAKQKIEAARANLKEAGARIKRKDAEEGDIKHATEAIEALKTELEAASALESKDTEYSKYSLQVRKELAGQRTAVEAKQLELSVEASRKELTRAQGELTGALAKIQKKDAVDADFDRAKSAADEVEKALAAGEGLGGKDARYGKYLAGMKDRFAAQKQAIDKRKKQMSAQKQRATVAEAEKALAAALNALKAKDVPPAKFDEAEAAAKALAKVLEDGKNISSGDKEYSSYAAASAKRVEEANKRIAARRAEVEVDHQRALVAEALAAVKKTTARLNNAEDIQAAENAIAELQKNLDAGDKYGAKDPKYSKFAIEALKTAVASRKKVSEKKESIAGESQRAKIEAATRTLKEALAPLDAFSPNEDQFKAAIEATAALKKALEEGAEQERKNSKYATQAGAARKLLAAAEKRTEKRKLEIAVRERRMLIEDAVSTARTAIENAQRTDANGDAVKGAADAMKALREETEKGVALEKQDKAYEQFAAAVRAGFAKLDDDLSATKQKVGARESFYSGPAKSYSKGKALLAEAEAAQEPEAKKKVQSAALSEFESCLAASKILEHEHPELSKVEFEIDGQKITLPAVVETCQTQSKTLRAIVYKPAG